MIKLILNIFLLTTIFSFIYCQETEPPCEENGNSSDQTTDTPSVTKKVIPPFDFIFPKRTPPPNFCHDELNEEYFDCIGLCPQYKHFRDKNCEDVAKEEQQKHITTTESLLSKKLHHLCFSLRCFPGCRCKEGLVREFYGKNATCILPEKCKDVTVTTTTEKNCEENGNN